MKTLPAVLLMILCAVFPALGGEVEAYFINIGPGRNIYELDGHAAIAVVENGRRAAAYNYGVFDFAAPNFLWRFVKGETDYMCTAEPLDFFLNSYAGSGRRVDIARLDLDSLQTARLLQILDHDSHPLYRTYRYNYVLDNCATRPLRAVELAVGDSILLAPAPAEELCSQPLTFRKVMRKNHRNYPWYQFGIDLALGSGIDRPIDRREASFAPTELMEMLPAATVAGRPVVAQAWTLQSEIPEVATEGPTPFVLSPLFVSLVVLAIAIWLSIRDLRRGRSTRWFDSAYFGMAGLAGILLTFLIFVSVHEATSPNWLYGWLNPLCLVAAVGVWIKSARKIVICYYFINFVVVIALAAAWYWIPQSANLAFAPLVTTDLIRSATYLYINRK